RAGLQRKARTVDGAHRPRAVAFPSRTTRPETAATPHRRPALTNSQTCSRGRGAVALVAGTRLRSEEHTSELQSLTNLVCRLLLPRPPTPTLFPYTTLFRSSRRPSTQSADRRRSSPPSSSCVSQPYDSPRNSSDAPSTTGLDQQPDVFPRPGRRSSCRGNTS